MRKRSWPNRKNRPCPDCGKMLTYTRKDSFDLAVGNNTVCKSCAQMDRKLTIETIEKMKKPKTDTHKRNISKSMKTYWEKLKREDKHGTYTQSTIRS
jgi:DNA-directed RNA polymerase subunit M/transcription elongation factor TFIIS